MPLASGSPQDWSRTVEQSVVGDDDGDVTACISNSGRKFVCFTVLLGVLDH